MIDEFKNYDRQNKSIIATIKNMVDELKKNDRQTQQTK